MESASDDRHEFIDGEVYVFRMMSGGKLSHARIITNLLISLGRKLDGGKCSLFSSDMMVKTASGMFVYPDVSVVCGDPVIEQRRGMEMITNPTLLVEVMSKTSESMDRGKKWRAYQTIPTLRDYLLIRQTTPVIERFTRESNGEWSKASTVIYGLDQMVELPSIECVLALSDVYEKVSFEQDAEQEGD